MLHVQGVGYLRLLNVQVRKSLGKKEPRATFDLVQLIGNSTHKTLSDDNADILLAQTSIAFTDAIPYSKCLQFYKNWLEMLRKISKR